MNRLRFETSPYLLQHQHNPVDWYPWGDEAFQKAKSEDKPILVSIGYATCHWCHVMERESFEDQDTADIMNQFFVCIKVDREERPDLDNIYMQALLAISGQGGWPLNMFLTPDGLPFMGGTYYPPLPAYGRPSWNQVLLHLSRAWREKREQVIAQAQRLTELIAKHDRQLIFNGDILVPMPDSVAKTDIDQLYSHVATYFDTEAGGFGTPPKFPNTMVIDFLMQYGLLTGRQEALSHARFTLETMARGGIYDQLRGGFARYATDRYWLVPHFEKMLYDNALLLCNYADAYRIWQTPLFKTTIEDTIAFVLHEMSGAHGGFFSALDADSEGEEGKFYIWTYDEIKNVLSHPVFDLFCAAYDVTQAGNWEGHTILWQKMTSEELAHQFKLSESEVRMNLAAARQQLLEIRAGRTRPSTDDKQILAWNALMVKAILRCGQVLGRSDYIDVAVRQADYLLVAFRHNLDNATYFHTIRNGVGKHEAFLDDLVFLADTLTALYQHTGRTDFLQEAERIVKYVFDNFSDSDSDFFFLVPSGTKDLIVRQVDVYDNATPSGNSTLVHLLLDLAVLTDKAAWSARAEKMLLRLKSRIINQPLSFGRWATALMRIPYPTAELAIIGKDHLRLAEQFYKLALPHTILVHSAIAHADQPLTAGRGVEGRNLIYVCHHNQCLQPVETLSEAVEQIKNQIK